MLGSRGLDMTIPRRQASKLPKLFRPVAVIGTVSRGIVLWRRAIGDIATKNVPDAKGGCLDD